MQIFYNVIELIHTGDMTPVLLVDLMTLNSIVNLNLLNLKVIMKINPLHNIDESLQIETPVKYKWYKLGSKNPGRLFAQIVSPNMNNLLFFF